MLMVSLYKLNAPDLDIIHLAGHYLAGHYFVLNIIFQFFDDSHRRSLFYVLRSSWGQTQAHITSQLTLPNCGTS